jgi:integrase
MPRRAEVRRRKTRHPGVYQLDGRFQLRWTVQVQGQRRDTELMMPEGTTLEEAVAERARRVAAAKAPLVEPPPGPPTVGAYARSWLERKVPSMKASTADEYARVLSFHVLPALVDERGEVELGDYPLDYVTRAEVERWVTWAERQTRPANRKPDAPQVPVARATLLGWWTKIRHLLRDAAAQYQLPDATLRVKGPRAYDRAPVKELRTLTPDELGALFDHVADGWHAELYTLSVLGCRAGELYALTWPEVDLERRTVTIRKSHYRGIVGTTKTNKVKVIPIPDQLLAVLRAHRSRQIRDQHPALASALVFPMTEDGRHYDEAGRLVEDRGWHRSPSAALGQLKKASKKAGLPVAVTPQVLRRTVNSLLVDGGVERLVIRSILGHMTDQMTAHYYHAPAAAKMAAVTHLERVRKA